MSQPARFARPPLPVPSDERPVASQHIYSRQVSKTARFGFVVLSAGLAAMTFLVTIWGIDFPQELRAEEMLSERATSVIAGQDFPPAQADVIYEPKTTGRLPVFGGMTYAER